MAYILFLSKQQINKNMKIILAPLLVCLIAATFACATNTTTFSAKARQARFEERKFRNEEDQKQISSFLNAKNILKTVIKLVFGSDEESRATSRQVLNVFVKVSCFSSIYSIK